MMAHLALFLSKGRATYYFELPHEIGREAAMAFRAFC